MPLSEYDYRIALDIATEDPPFYALIGAAMLKADTRNTAILRTMFPDTYIDLDRLYNRK